MLLVSHTGGQAHTPHTADAEVDEAAEADVAPENAPSDALDEVIDGDEAAEADAAQDETEGEDGAEAEAVEADGAVTARASEVREVPAASAEADHPSLEQRDSMWVQPPTPAPAPPPATMAGGPRGAVPYAPGARTHMTSPQGNARTTGQNGGSQNGGESGGRAPAVPAPQPGRVSRFERDRDRDRSEHEPLRPEVRGDVGPLIDSLRELFVQDRSVASQGGTTRCGICYLHFSLSELEYREAEGYYVCSRCARALGHARLPMVRRQQRS